MLRFCTKDTHFTLDNISLKQDQRGKLPLSSLSFSSRHIRNLVSLCFSIQPGKAKPSRSVTQQKVAENSCQKSEAAQKGLESSSQWGERGGDSLKGSPPTSSKGGTAPDAHSLTITSEEKCFFNENVQAYSRAYGLSDTPSIAEQKGAISQFINVLRTPPHISHSATIKHTKLSLYFFFHLIGQESFSKFLYHLGSS